MRAELQTLLDSLPDLAAEEVPRLLGELEEVRATAMMRMTTPAPARIADQLLNIAQAAERTGLSKDYLYKHPELPFARQIGRKRLFSSLGIDKWMAKR